MLEALLELRSGEAPAEVSAATERLLRAHAPWALDVVGLAQCFIEAAGGPRDQRLFLSWSLSADTPTFAEVAKREGVPTRYANKLVRRAEERVRRALPGAPVPLPGLVSALQSRLGGVAPAVQLREELDRLGAHEAPAAPLLAWLAGPYVAVPGRPGWVATDPKAALARTGAALAEDGGTRRLVDLEAELAELCLSPASFVAWLSANGAVVVHDLAVSVSGSLANVLERLLDAYGTPRAPGQVLADLATGGRVVGPKALDAAMAERRFRRSSTGEVALAAWPEHEDRKTVDRKAVDRKTAVKKRPPTPATGTVSSEPDEGGVLAERVWLWVRVDAGVIKGLEAPVPAGLVEALGLAPLSRRTFSSRYGPVSLANEPPQALRGPLRAVVLAAGARPDDTVLLGFSRNGDLEVEVRRGPAQAGPVDMAEKATHFQAIATGGR